MEVKRRFALRRGCDNSKKSEAHGRDDRRLAFCSGLISAGFARLTILCVLAISLLLSVRVASADICLQLAERGDPWTYGAGARGLYLGHDFTHTTHEMANFLFVDVKMVIDEDSGDAEIFGTMERMGGPVGEETWLISSLSLNDIEFKRPDGSYQDGGNYDPPSDALTAAMFAEFQSGMNPFGPEDWSGVSGWGFEWKTLNMMLAHPVGTSEIPNDGWTGFAMPDMGHLFVAELHYDVSLGFTFEAWYRNDASRAIGGYYNTGDTKGTGEIINTPEPSTYALALLGAMGLAVVALRRSCRRHVSRRVTGLPARESGGE